MTSRDRTVQRSTRRGRYLATRRRRQGRDESGAALVELSLVIIPFLLILFGLITFGVILALKQSVTNAAAEGARSAVGIASDVDAVARATATATDRLDWLRPDQQAALVIDAQVLDPCPAGSGRCMQVVVTYPYDAQPLVPELPFISAATPSSFSSTAVVQITE